MSAELEPQPLGDFDFNEASSAYDRGDFRSARRIAHALARSPISGSASAARDLLRRTGVDPAQVFVLAACALFFAWVVWRYGT